MVWRAGRSGFLYTAVGIAFALVVGSAIGRLVAVHARASFLISTGTAICGGSAIAAVGPVLGATEDEMSISLGTIFLLNSLALLTFPVIGTTLKLSQSQFGLWAALAIHDTSSVVGACAKYGMTAAMANTYLFPGSPVYQFLSRAGKRMLIFTLFLIGATLSPAALRKVGPRPLIQGVLLWIVVAVASLLAIRAGWISI